MTLHLKHIFLFFILLLVANTSAQQLEFLGHFRSSNHVKSTAICTDNDGNIYIVGTIEIDSADLDPGAGTYYLSPEFSSAAFVTKLDSLGNFIWAKRFGGGSSISPKSVAVDDFGGVYIGGSFFSTVDFDPGPSVFNLSVFGGSDFFLSKLNNMGDFEWAFNAGSTSTESVNDIAIDTDNNVYITGYFDYADFDPGAGTFTLNPQSNAGFIAKYTPNGSFVNAVDFEGNGLSGSNSIAIASNGSLYVVGAFDSTIDFDPGPGNYNLTSVSSNVDIYVCKLDTALNFQWAESFGSSSADNGYTVSVNDSDEPVITAGFANTIDVDPGPNTFNVTSNGMWDNLLLKLDANGGFIWANTYGNAESDPKMEAVISPNNDIYLLGKFSDTLDIDGGPGTQMMISSSPSDAFIARLDASGNLLAYGQMGGPGSVSGKGICITLTQKIYHTGIFAGTADLDPSVALDSLTSLGLNDSYIQISMPASTLNISELTPVAINKNLIKIVDLMGRETEGNPNTVLIYIYSDGTTEKVFRVE